ncbi:MAG: site-specific integrase [Flavisolibacter sp.]|nr:site-specific integrase [Flavisolibacter sp.]
MEAKSTFSILFWIAKNRLKNGKAPISCRITVNGQRAELSAQREVDVLDWDTKAQIVIGRNQEAKEINNHLAMIKVKLLNCQSKLEARGIPITAEALKLEYTGIIERPRMLMEIIRQHNADIKTLINKVYSKATWVKYETTKKHLEAFLKWKYSITDLDIKKLGFEFITDFEFYLRSQKNIDINTNGKYIKNVKKIIKECVAKNWLEKDPFMAYKVKAKKTERDFLTELELQAIQDKEFEIERLAQIRDIFVFSCYTGLAYIDLYNLSPNNISLGIDGEKWIFTHRQKTETASRIPLLPPAQAILDKYADHPATIQRKKLLPVPSNQKLNAYLKEIATTCKITKELTFHVARHTFATTVTLTNGVPIETVSKMLGHTKLQTTQIYARILDKKVSSDMQALRNKFQSKANFMEMKTGS